MSLESAQKVYGYPKSINIAVVEPSAGISLKNLTETIMQSVSYGNALTEDERNDLIQPILEQVTVWNLGIQAVVFSISLILVMTVTVMSVSERRRDFATLNAIGAPLRYVFGIVLLEAALIGVVGGANIPVALFFPSIFEIVPPIYLLEIFASVVGVCCAGSIVPAVNAMRMRIADVLRAEY
jgi:ABC-type antimicrobial peptide transport system permease subunit